MTPEHLRTRVLAALWWAEEFQGDPKKRLLLFSKLLLTLPSKYPATIHVDYDPDEYLLEALHQAEIECRGNMFSANGIWPGKTTMVIDEKGIRVAVGHGQPFVAVEEYWRRLAEKGGGE